MFEADDIDDAFLKLAEHFRALGEAEDTTDVPWFFETGSVSIQPVEEP